MEQIEVISWKTLDAIKQASTHLFDTIGDLDTNEQMAIFCSVDEDFFELYWSELESNYIRHFEDEEEMYKFIEIRKSEFGEDDFDSSDFYEEETFEDADEDYRGFSIRDNQEEDDDF